MWKPTPKSNRNRHTGRVNSATKFLIDHALPERFVTSDREYYIVPMRAPKGVIKCTMVRVR